MEEWKKYHEEWVNWNDKVVKVFLGFFMTIAYITGIILGIIGESIL